MHKGLSNSWQEIQLVSIIVWIQTQAVRIKLMLLNHIFPDLTIVSALGVSFSVIATMEKMLFSSKDEMKCFINAHMIIGMGIPKEGEVMLCSEVGVKLSSLLSPVLA